MSLLTKDYKRLYQLQDKFLDWWKVLGMPFYLTGGTALGRFYLNHRYSEDLDFFINANPEFPNLIGKIRKEMVKSFQVDMKNALFSDDFVRVFISEDGLNLKIDFVNDVEYYFGKPELAYFGLVDTPINILANKMSAIMGRDEPKDIFDIIYIALNYAFNWKEIFYIAKEKAILNEIDVEKRLISFPVELLERVNWLDEKPDLEVISKQLEKIADDFLLGSDNSLSKQKQQLQLAKPALKNLGPGSQK